MNEKQICAGNMGDITFMCRPAMLPMIKPVPEDEKNCARGLENGPSPKGEGRFQVRGHSFSNPDRRCR
jgi:hypothetical protein